MIFKFLNRIGEKALSLLFDYIDVKVAEKWLKSLEKGLLTVNRFSNNT